MQTNNTPTNILNNKQTYTYIHTLLTDFKLLRMSQRNRRDRQTDKNAQLYFVSTEQ